MHMNLNPNITISPGHNIALYIFIHIPIPIPVLFNAFNITHMLLLMASLFKIRKFRPLSKLHNEGCIVIMEY